MTMTLSGTSGIVLPTAAAPAFSATPSTGQAVSASTWTKVLFQTEQFDTNSNFASSTFTPTVAGYYQISAVLANGPGILTLVPAIYKNGTSWLAGVDVRFLGGTYGGVNGTAVSDLMYLNGSTDYVEIYVYMSSGTLSSGATGLTCKFTGVMVRSA